MNSWNFINASLAFKEKQMGTNGYNYATSQNIKSLKGFLESILNLILIVINSS